MTQVYNQKILEDRGLSENDKIDLVLKAILETKGLNAEQEQVDFLNPDFDQLHDPKLFKDMHLACEIIAQSIKAREKILIYGDYDCDGLTSTAILVRLLRKLEANVFYFIPNRLDDGYGLSDSTVEQVLKMDPDLLITVDCGINSYKEIEKLMLNDIKVIVSDHHQPGGQYASNALAVINPQVDAGNYPFTDLAGAGVAFKLAEALVEFLAVKDIDLSPALCLAAVGTVADSMPLVGENRALVSLATSIFKEKAPLGLRILSQRFNNSDYLEASFFSFVIGPRLNAAGRMGDLEPAIQLLISDDEKVVEEAIRKLEDLNNQRKNLESSIFEEAVMKIDQMPQEDKENIILVADENWHSGITGIVSSRLMEKFSVPVITFAGSDGKLKGSARSFGSFDILAAVSAGSELLEAFGGHLQAAGVTVSVENYEAFKRIVLDYALAHPIDQSEILDRQYLLELPHDLVGDNLAQTITRLEPFGQKNEKPSFIIRNLQIDQWREVGQGRHISLSLRLDDSRLISAISFQAQEFSRIFKKNDIVDLMVNLNWREWNGKYSSQLQVLDWRISTLDNLLWDSPNRIESTYEIDYKEIEKLEKMYGFHKLQFSISNEQISSVTRYIYQYSADLIKGFNMAILARAIVREMRIFLNPFILHRIIDMLKEISVLEYRALGSRNFVIDLLPAQEISPNIQDSKTWKNLNEQGYIVNDQRSKDKR